MTPYTLELDSTREYSPTYFYLSTFSFLNIPSKYSLYISNRIFFPPFEGKRVLIHTPLFWQLRLIVGGGGVSIF
jgi:hypothetical protein